MSNRSGRTPTVSFVPALLVGWWATTFLLESLETVAVRRTLERAPAAVPLDRGGGGRRPLASPRVLREAPGVGPRRSVDVARFLWAKGHEAPIETVRGIGPKTSRSLREALADAGLSPSR